MAPALPFLPRPAASARTPTTNDERRRDASASGPGGRASRAGHSPGQGDRARDSPEGAPRGVPAPAARAAAGRMIAKTGSRLRARPLFVVPQPAAQVVEVPPRPLVGRSGFLDDRAVGAAGAVPWAGVVEITGETHEGKGKLRRPRTARARILRAARGRSDHRRGTRGGRLRLRGVAGAARRPRHEGALARDARRTQRPDAGHEAERPAEHLQAPARRPRARARARAA